MDYDIKSIASALRGAVGGQTDEQTAALAEKDKAAKLRALQEEQAQIDEFNARARQMGFTLRPDVIVNGVPVEKSSATAAVQEAAEPIDEEDTEAPTNIVDSVRSDTVMSMCERQWATMNPEGGDPMEKKSFIESCAARSR